MNSPVEPGRASILVVDDLEASRYLTSSWLRRNGYRVSEARTGQEALTAVAEEELDLVLLDVHLPDMSGFEVCERVKGDPRTAAMPVIHISATAIEVEDRTAGLDRGADGYLVEPVDPGELVATVEAALRYYRARTRAERLALRLGLLTRATLEMNSARTFDDVLAAAATGAATIFEGPASVVSASHRGLVRSAATDAAAEPPVVRADTLRALEQVTGTVAADAPASSVFPAPDGLSMVALVYPNPSRVPVAITVAASGIRSEDDRNLLLQLGQATALACETMRTFSEEHQLALTLQQSLLPRELPARPELEMAARYAPASDNAEIGGDFYEVSDIDGRLLIAVGDVVGHSIEAATVMGEVRHALRAYAVEGHGPVEILNLLDAMLRRYHPRSLTTLCLVVLDPASGELEIASAGHIPPLLADAAGARYVKIAGPLLGIGLPRPPATALTLDHGSLMLLVTDGLIERRGSVIDDGMDLLRTAVTHDADLETLCDTLLDRFGEAAEDDIALLAFRRR
ncbi:fused response regulator/phosphatase [Amycolatopsis sp. WQ 127309]|uniref:fused response regulator/phosphatase n=1 Tax=Amycolatopsis sp. WQ 127309 TaxID=2932773 RepID=UPI001FF0E130|nr:fused response regulator/phosphatase [Amycolatopsis sp. WQ 127309]UOZ07116.1 fused response regulator/phosphatase [Amycolatopsis sp. WQ 127309]